MMTLSCPLQGWGPYAQLLIDLFNFLSPFLRNAELAKPVTILYRGCLRVLLVLLHDFPEFLCDYHYNFCDVIPPNCIQVRGIPHTAQLNTGRNHTAYRPTVIPPNCIQVSHTAQLHTD